jgi:2-oxoisovalerate dehydrogenase E2 component (dihydrolipoyl transacylase)
VVADQPLVSVETDKAVVEVPSPRSGRIMRLFGAKGDVVKVGAPLVEYADGTEADVGAIVGELVRDEQKPEALTASTTSALHQMGGTRSIQALPAVRALARKLGVDLTRVQASGANDTITRADVEREAQHATDAAPVEVLKGMRRSMAQRMAIAHAEVVPASVNEEADIGDWSTDQDATIRIVRAIATACKVEPSLNVWFNAQSNERRLHKTIDVGIAVDTEGGLIVPVLRNIGERDASNMRAGLDRMRADARARTIPPDDLRGATITLSNFGMIGGRFASLVVVPPQVAIIGTGRISSRVLVRDNVPAVRRTLPISLTFDHRVVTGGEAARFLVALKSDLESAQ